MVSRNTRQKELIKEEIEKFSNFFTSEDIYDKVIKKDKKIGIATVYRYLKELRERRQLHSYLCDRRTIYSRQKNNHCHYVCQKCGKVNHIDIDKLDFLKKKINGSICHFQIDIHGVCGGCSNER